MSALFSSKPIVEAPVVCAAPYRRRMPRLDAGREHRDERAEDRTKKRQRADRQQGQQRDDEHELGDALATVAIQVAHLGSILSLACLQCSIAARRSRHKRRDCMGRYFYESLISLSHYSRWAAQKRRLLPPNTTWQIVTETGFSPP